MNHKRFHPLNNSFGSAQRSKTGTKSNVEHLAQQVRKICGPEKPGSSGREIRPQLKLGRWADDLDRLLKANAA
jgi:hypothetical protein